jgi:hypothetical protein
LKGNIIPDILIFHNPFRKNRGHLEPFESLHCHNILTTVVAGLGCGDSVESPKPSEVRLLALSKEGRDVAILESSPRDSSREIVYSASRKLTSDFEVVSFSETGDLSNNQWQRVARPYRHLNSGEQFVYDEHAWGGENPDGTIESRYSVTRRSNTSPALLGPDNRPAKVSPELLLILNGKSPGDDVEVLVGIRNFPDWDIPILPPARFRSLKTMSHLRAERTRAIETRALEFTQRSLGVRAEIVAFGGRVHSELFRTGYLHASLPARSVNRLLQNPEVLSIEPQRFDVLGGDEGIDLGAERVDSRANAEFYQTSGHNADEANPSRHSYGRVTAAVIEPYYFEDDACAFQDGINNCGNDSTDRIYTTKDCASSSCSFVGSFSGAQNHGTLVASVLGGDYEDFQAYNEYVGDSSWTSLFHSSAWRRSASGIAPEAGLLLYGGSVGCNGCYAAAFDEASDDGADVINGSWMYPNATECDPTSSHALEDAAENAYDDGAFIAMCSGNNSVTSTTCNVAAPADTPKLVSVGALDSGNTPCITDYDNCEAENGRSSRGNGSLVVNGVTHAASMMDLLAAGEFVAVTDGGGPYGEVRQFESGGCSLATPYAAGAASLQKGFMLDAGNTWINSPGRLQAQMLAMADSWGDVAKLRKPTGMDPLSGAGRLKMKLFKNSQSAPFWWRSSTYSYTTTGTTSFLFRSTPMASGTEIFKCALWEGEDKSHKSDVSDVTISITIREPVGGACSTSGTILATISDASYDIRHKASLTSSDVTLDGKCAEITLDRWHITSSGTTVNAFCYGHGSEKRVVHGLNDRPESARV